MSYIAIFRFSGRHLAFCVSRTSAGIGNDSIELGDPENGGIAIETVRLSVVEREIQLLPVWRSSFLTSCISRNRDLID
jgi:hypothetical protein